jgi:hypothetical protein
MAHKCQSREVTSMVEEDCCDTACLIQPRFFHGQLLTDADLNQLLSWTEGKFRLQRTANGWGVVCGLHLSIDPEQPTHVIIHPGQGIDCCGHDLVVCEPISFDVSDACPKEECLEPSYNRWGKTTHEEEKRESEEYPHEHPETTSESQRDLFQNSRVLDLFLHYATEGDDAQVRLGGRGSECEYSRLKETVKPKWEEARELRRDAIDRASAYEADYRKKLRNYLDYVQTAQMKVEAGQLLKPWLLQGLDSQPLHQFGFVRDWVNALENNDKLSEITRILFYKNMDDLLFWLRCDCAGCSSETGLPVGRIWLEGPDQSVNSSCRILWVSDQLPYRRELRKETCYPSLPFGRGCVNLAPHLWQEWQIASASLSELAISPALGDPQIIRIENWDMLQMTYGDHRTMSILTGDPFAPNAPLTPLVAELGEPFGNRLIGFID